MTAPVRDDRLERPDGAGAHRRASAARRAPAEPEFWILVFGDLAVFTALFAAWGWAEAGHHDAFAADRLLLDRPIGLANTLLLLASSAAVAIAVHAAREGAAPRARRAYLAAIGCGLGFLGLKAVEYAGHIGAGETPDSGQFFMYYFVLTGIHALHVLLGLVALAVARSRSRAEGAPKPLLHEAVGVYWHMIDVVWVILFAIIYLA